MSTANHSDTLKAAAQTVMKANDACRAAGPADGYWAPEKERFDLVDADTALADEIEVAAESHANESAAHWTTWEERLRAGRAWATEIVRVEGPRVY